MELAESSACSGARRPSEGGEAGLGFHSIFLATSPSFPFAGLLAGTLLGHGLVTALAVGAGRWIGRRVDEKLLHRLSAGLFLLFGLLTLRRALLG